MNFLKKLFLFSVLALAVAWPLLPQRAGQTRRDREPTPRVRADNERTVVAAAPAQWARRYYYYQGPGGNLPAKAMQQTPDGGYIIAGEALEYDVGLDWSHVHIWKLDSQGAVEWAIYLEQDVWWGGFSFARGVAQTPDGGYVVAGYFGAQPGYWLIKLSAAGVLEWQKQSRDSGSAYAFLLSRDGGFVLAGGQGQGLWIMKLDSNGDVEWQKRYHEQGLTESARAIAQTPDGGYITTGGVSSGDDYSDILVMKLDPLGEVEWRRRYSEPGDEVACSVQPLPDGSYIIAGTRAESDSYYKDDALVMRLSPDGNIIWCSAYTGLPTYYGGASEIRQTPDGGSILACPSALIKIDAYGDIVWQRTYWSIDYYPPYSYKIFFSAYAGRPTQDGNFIFAGKYHGLAVFKTDSQGIIAGCPLLHDSSCTVMTPAIAEKDWSPTVTSPSGGSPGAPFIVRTVTPITEVVCLPTFFELTIAAGPGGTTKPEPATHAYAGGTSVKVYALPDERHVFSFWSGDVPERKRLENPVRIDMDGDKSIKANFARPNFQLTIAAGDGGTTDPAPGSHTYVGDTIVRIEALPDASHVFTSWTGDVPEANRGDNPVMLEMDSNKSVQANFAIKRILRLSAGTGGTTEPTPGVYALPHGSTISVKGVPDLSHVFSQWAGDVVDARKADNPLSVLMDIDRTLAAGFLARILAPLELRAETRENRSLFTVEYINVLTWKPNPKNVDIRKYRIYELQGENLVLLGEAAVGSETYWHRKVGKGKSYTYVVKAVGENNREGDPATVTITVS